MLAMLIIWRLIEGTFGSSPLANAGGTLADVWMVVLCTRKLTQPHQRGKAMSIFAAAPFLGPVFGPIIGGFLSQYVNWRWTLWVALIFAGLLFAMALFCLPETYTKILLEQKAKRLRKATGNDKLYSASEKNKP